MSVDWSTVLEHVHSVQSLLRGHRLQLSPRPEVLQVQEIPRRFAGLFHHEPLGNRKGHNTFSGVRPSVVDMVRSIDGERALTMLLDIEMKKRERQPKRTVRCRNIRSGIVALSTSRHCRKPKPIISPIILLERHGMLLPPQCGASNKRQMAPRSRTIPRGSRCCDFRSAGSFSKGLSLRFNLRPRKIRKKTTARMGRLLVFRQPCKMRGAGTKVLHPRTPSPYCMIVKAPPSTGLTLADIPKQLTTTPICRGRLSRGEIAVITLMAP